LHFAVQQIPRVTMFALRQTAASAQAKRVAQLSYVRAALSTKATPSTDPKWYIDTEEKHGAMNYLPLPVVLSRGEGVHVWDVAGELLLFP
jgi:hypothetical protein